MQGQTTFTVISTDIHAVGPWLFPFAQYFLPLIGTADYRPN